MRLNAGPINELLTRCTVPTVVTVVTASLCGVISHVFVNRNIKPVTVDNLTIAFPFVGLSNTFNTTMNINSSALVDIDLNHGSCSHTRLVFNDGVALGIIVNVIFKTIYLVFLSPVLHLFNTSSRALPCTERCARVVLTKGIVARLCLNVGTILQSTSVPHITVKLAVLAIVIGAVLSPIFVCIFR